MAGCFITATDTGVGKTFVTALLARMYTQKKEKVIVWKPFATGNSDDMQFVYTFAGLAVTKDDMSCIQYALPLAPYAAEMETGVPWEKGHVFAQFHDLSTRYDWMIVEGIGGVAVPLTEQYHVAHFMADIGYPALLVARPTLGTLNHTLLSIRYLETCGVSIKGIVLNAHYPLDPMDVSVKSNANIIERESGYPVLCHIPYFDVPEEAVYDMQCIWEALQESNGSNI